ncbi:MAG TPA: hypothetical protein VMJ93_04910 [Verrucomicrobiae bacterium]|nr:hypothetical protein [Verrucomicrobiae bacterium]
MAVAENIALMRRWYHDLWNEGRTDHALRRTGSEFKAFRYTTLSSQDSEKAVRTGSKANNYE